MRGALQYSFDEKSPTGGKTVGGYLRYAADGLAAGLGYQNYEFASGKKLEAWTLGGSYRMDKWYFHAGYGENKVDQLTSPVDLAVLGCHVARHHQRWFRYPIPDSKQAHHL